MPDLTSPVVLWGVFWSLARGACCIASYEMLRFHWVDAAIATRIGGSSLTLATLMWIIYTNHFEAKKLKNGKCSPQVLTNPTQPTP